MYDPHWQNLDKLDPLDDNGLHSFAAEHEWTYARTMEWCPHWYLVKARARSAELFNRFERTIQLRGVDGWFYSKERRYLHFEGYKYWAMDISNAGGRIINTTSIAWTISYSSRRSCSTLTGAVAGSTTSPGAIPLSSRALIC